MPTRWCVTGAAGFIGSNLCDLLLKHGETVVGVDNFHTGSRANLDLLRQAGGDRFRFVEADIRDGAAMAAAVAGCETVVNLAAQVSVQRSIEDPVGTESINVGGFATVLATAAAAGVRRFAYASSCAVYGACPDLPLREDARPQPLSPYAVSKLANERQAAAQAGDMRCYGLRLFNIFGPRQDGDGGYAAVIPKWLGQCLAGERPVMFGDGSATRDFCHVANVCRLILDLAGEAEARPGIYNVGSGVPVTLAELFATLAARLAAHGRALGFDAPERRPWRSGDIVHSFGDISAAREHLGYRPEVGLAEGLDSLIAEAATG